MKSRRRAATTLALVALVAWPWAVEGCGSSSNDAPTADAAPVDDGAAPDVAAEPSDAGLDASDAANTDVGMCASSFGDALTEGFGRIDGTLVAIVRPVDQQCAQPNRGHVILQVKMSGAVYRLLVNVESTVGGVDPRVLIASVSKPLPSPAWSEGWHSGVKLDYVTDFALHAGDFTAMEKADLVTRVVAEMHIGAPISVYGTSGAGRPESAHLIHRNGNDDDGAVVVGPDTATPRILLFHFAEQSF